MHAIYSNSTYIDQHILLLKKKWPSKLRITYAICENILCECFMRFRLRSFGCFRVFATFFNVRVQYRVVLCDYSARSVSWKVLCIV